MSNSRLHSDIKGSLWRRWDPHIHTPGTVLNDQYGNTTLEQWCETVDACSPGISALGITDYCSLNTYKQIISLKEQGYLKSVSYIFPNIEFRLAISTNKGTPVNFHLLVDSHDNAHIENIEHFLASLTFRANEKEFRCTETDLINLGFTFGANISDNRQALKTGVNQFKVNFDNLRNAWEKDKWIQSNALIGCPLGDTDGTSGMRDKTGAFFATRSTMESFSHIVFSGRPGDAKYWAGEGVDSIQQVISKYRSLKPCLHGSDAHELTRAGNPDEKRYCWIKGDLTFESLRQACIEPSVRAFVGEKAPNGPSETEVIKSVHVNNAGWLSPDLIELNSGLVAIIGARGSGKTALADMIAFGADAPWVVDNPQSFVYRAIEHLANSTVELTWGDSEVAHRSLTDHSAFGDFSFPRVQYLSQQFVEKLCSSERLDQSLVDEIHRVIFAAHDTATRGGSTNFNDLLSIKTQTARDARDRAEEQLEGVKRQLLEQRQIKSDRPGLVKQLADQKTQLDRDAKEQQALAKTANQETISAHNKVRDAMQFKQSEYDKISLQIRALEGLNSDAVDFRDRRADSYVSSLKANRTDAGLSESDWQKFKPEILAASFTWLANLIQRRKTKASTVLGVSLLVPAGQSDEIPLIPAADDLSSKPVAVLKQESERLSRLIGIDNNKAVKFNQLNSKIDLQQRSIDKLEKSIEASEGIDNVISQMLTERNQAYKAVFQSFCDYESALRDLYTPLEKSIQSSGGAASSLSFAIRRAINIESWVQQGENLIDLRLEGPFRLRGSLLRLVQEELLPAWSSDSPEVVYSGVGQFFKTYEQSFEKHRRQGVSDTAFRMQIADWLLSTGHITTEYAVQYNGVEIERLSPGTRGIVLLMLYLAIDKEDVRPLIIDQPEENLDPKSIFDELVHRFREVRHRRQVIIVTHNANLVVNTDADQVIVASAGAHAPRRLPHIEYQSGGLENPAIRKAVCDILEGGEEAFRARAKKLHLE